MNCQTRFFAYWQRLRVFDSGYTLKISQMLFEATVRSWCHQEAEILGANYATDGLEYQMRIFRLEPDSTWHGICHIVGLEPPRLGQTEIRLRFLKSVQLVPNERVPRDAPKQAVKTAKTQKTSWFWRLTKPLLGFATLTWKSHPQIIAATLELMNVPIMTILKTDFENNLTFRVQADAARKQTWHLVPDFAKPNRSRFHPYSSSASWCGSSEVCITKSSFLIGDRTMG